MTITINKSLSWNFLDICPNAMMVKLLMTHIIIYSHFSKIFEEGLIAVNLLVISLELKMCKIRMEEMQNKLFLGKNSSLV